VRIEWYLLDMAKFYRAVEEDALERKNIGGTGSSALDTCKPMVCVLFLGALFLKKRKDGWKKRGEGQGRTCPYSSKSDSVKGKPPPRFEVHA